MGRSATADLLCASAQARRSSSWIQASSARKGSIPIVPVFPSTLGPSQLDSVNQARLQPSDERPTPTPVATLLTRPRPCRHATHPTRCLPPHYPPDPALAVTLPTRPRRSLSCSSFRSSPDRVARCRARRYAPHPTATLAVTLADTLLTRPRRSLSCSPFCYPLDRDARCHATRATTVEAPRRPLRLVYDRPSRPGTTARRAVVQSPPIVTSSATKPLAGY
jgi:hypothetical protein